jgi:hypothetical protein
LQVEVTKRHAFLTMVVGVVYQHLACFRQGATLLSRIEGPYSDAMAIVEHLQREGQGRQVCVCVWGGGGGLRNVDAVLGKGSRWPDGLENETHAGQLDGVSSQI